jgi:hypothetical protein
MLLDRLEQGVKPKGGAASRAKPGERVSSLAAGNKMPGAKMGVDQFQDPRLHLGNAGVIDEGAIPQPRQRGLEAVRCDKRLGVLAVGKIVNRLDVQIKSVEEQPARRAVGARVRGVVRKKRVQRVHADDVGAFFRPQVDQRCEIGEVADTPVALGAHAIELRCSAPDAAPVGQYGWRKTPGRHDDELRLSDIFAVGLQPEAVVSRRRQQRQDQLARDQLLAIERDALDDS